MATRLAPGLLVLVGAAAAVVVLAGLSAIASVAAPFFLALFLTVAASPLRNRLADRGAPGWVCTFAPFVAVIAVLSCLAAVIMFAVARLATVLPRYESRFTDIADSVSGTLARHGISGDTTRTALSSIDPAKLVHSLSGILAGTVSVTIGVVLTMMLLYGMALDGTGFDRVLKRVAVRRPQLIAVLHEYASATCRYFAVSTVFGLGVAVADVMALALLQVPLALLCGVLAFVTNYIPNVGFLIGVVPPALLALLASGPGTMVAVIAIYCALNFVIQSLVQPRFASDAAGLSVTVTLLSLSVWTMVLGPMGAILAVPMTGLARALLLDADPDKRWVRATLAADPAALDDKIAVSPGRD